MQETKNHIYFSPADEYEFEYVDPDTLVTKHEWKKDEYFRFNLANIQDGTIYLEDTCGRYIPFGVTDIQHMSTALFMLQRKLIDKLFNGDIV